MTQTVRSSTASDSYFIRLRACILTSFVLLVAASLMHMPPWVAMVGGACPLIYYHFGYLAPRAKTGLSAAAIDSVYYFGFLVTVFALAVSAVSLAYAAGQGQSPPVNEVAFQFGLGLLATGYAVLARMHLASISTEVEEASPEAVLDRYVQRSRELVTNVELASQQFVTLATSLMSKSEEVTRASQATVQSSMLELARVFDEQMRSTLASAREGLAEVRGLVQDTSFVQEREELVRSVKETLECVLALNKALGDFTARSSEGARTSNEVTSASTALRDSLLTFHANLEKVSGPQGPLLTAANAVSEASDIVAKGSRTLGDAVSELGEVAGTVSGVGVTFKNIKSLTSKAHEQLEALADSSERLEGASHRIAKTAEASGSLAENLDKTAQTLPALQELVQGLRGELDGLKSTVAGVEAGVRQLPQPIAEVVQVRTDVFKSLEQLAHVLADANDEAVKLAGNATAHATALERAHKAGTDMAALEATKAKLEEVLQAAAEGIKQIHGTLSTSTETLRDAVGAATTALESDVRRSSEVSRLFSERMTNVAQIVIDRTREGRPT